MVWRLAFRNLLRNRRRSISTAFGLSLAFVGICVLCGHIYKTHKASSSLIIYLHHLGHISIYKNGGVENLNKDLLKYQITEEELNKLQEILAKYEDKIEMMGQFLARNALLSSGTKSIPIFFQGITPELDKYVRNRPEVRRWLPGIVSYYSSDDLTVVQSKIPDGVSIANGVAELMKIQGPLEDVPLDQKEMTIAGRNIEGSLNAINATVALRHGTGMAFLDDVGVVGPISRVQELVGTKGIGHAVLFLKDMNQTKKMVKELKAEFSQTGLDLEPIPFMDRRIGLFYIGSMGFLLVVGLISGILIVAASTLIIFNSMTIGVFERSREIGTLKALGFKASEIVRLFSRETLLLVLASSLVGIVISEIVKAIINSLNLYYEAPGTEFPISLYIWIPPPFYIFLTVLFLIFAIYSTNRVAKKSAKTKVATLLLDSKI